MKQVAKKFAKPALIIAGTLFTAGVAAGGFGAFSGAQGIGGFMGAVGKTIASGASALTGGMIGGGAQAAGTSSMVGLGPLSNEAYAAATATQGRKGFLGNVLGAIGNFASTDTGKMVIAQGIMSGIQSYAAARQADQERKRFNKESVFGVQRQGSGGQSLLSAQLPDLAGPNQQMPSSDPYMPGAAPQYQTPNSQQGLLAQHLQPSQAPTSNLSPAWGGPQMMPIQGNYDMSYMFQNQGQNNNQQITPILPNIG